LKILDFYIIKNYKLTFVFVLLLISVVSIVMDYTEKVDAMISKKVPLSEMTTYYIAFVPYLSAFIFPLIIFISVIFYTSRITYRSEIIAMLSSGFSFNRLLAPFIFVSIVLAGVLLIANHIYIPRANKQRLKFESKYITPNTGSTENDMHLRISKNEFVYMKSFNHIAGIGYKFTYEKIENQKLSEKIFAEEIHFDTIKKNWDLQKVTIRKNSKDKEELIFKDKMKVKYNFIPRDLFVEFEQKSSMTTRELKAFITRESKRGNPSLIAYVFEFHRRSAAPFSVLILNIIGVCLACKKVRGGSGVQIAIGLLICGAYLIFMQFSTAFAVKGGLNPLLAAWIPNIIFSFIALYIYLRTKK
jgi:lipopolysaccharide export system permease protein